MLLALLISLVGVFAPAHAQNMALDPQNRVHVGLNVVDGPSNFGVTGGFDSRLTRVLALDVGGFASPIPIAPDYAFEGQDDAATPAFYRLRHGIYATPGFRIPHAQPKTWAWDVFLRGGGGVIWAANLSPDAPPDTGNVYAIRPDAAGVVGADVLIRFGRYGARVFGKAWMFDVLQTTPVRSYFVVRPQYGVEALVQW